MLAPHFSSLLLLILLVAAPTSFSSEEINTSEKKLKRTKRFGLPVCDGGVLECAILWSRTFAFRHNIDLVNIYDRLTNRDAPKRELQLEVARLRLQETREKAERESEESDAASEVGRLVVELAWRRHGRLLADLKAATKKLRSSSWKNKQRFKRKKRKRRKRSRKSNKE